MAEDVVNSHKDVSQTTTKIDWLSGPLPRSAISGAAVSKTMNWSTWFVLRVHLSTTNTDVKKKRPIGGDFAPKAILLQFEFFFFKEPRTAKNQFSIFLFGMGRSVVS